MCEVGKGWRIFLWTEWRLDIFFRRDFCRTAIAFNKTILLKNITRPNLDQGRAENWVMVPCWKKWSKIYSKFLLENLLEISTHKSIRKPTQKSSKKSNQSFYSKINSKFLLKNLLENLLNISTQKSTQKLYSKILYYEYVVGFGEKLRYNGYLLY